MSALDKAEGFGHTTTTQRDFVAFAGSLRARERAAAEELLARYSSQLVALARQRLGSRIAVKVDADDVLQSVMRTFFRRLDGGQIELRNWESLTALLTVMTLRKCQRQHRLFSSEMRDVGLESIIRHEDEWAALTIPDRTPSPLEVVAFTDLIEQMLARISPRDGEMIKLLLAGESVDEIAHRFRRSRRTVQRSLERIRQALTRHELLLEE